MKMFCLSNNLFSFFFSHLVFMFLPSLVLFCLVLFRSVVMTRNNVERREKTCLNLVKCVQHNNIPCENKHTNGKKLNKQIAKKKTDQKI